MNWVYIHYRRDGTIASTGGKLRWRHRAIQRARDRALLIAARLTERPIDGGRLAAGHEFDVCEKDDLVERTRLRFWQIVQLLPGQCRIYVFSCACPIDDADGLSGELAMVDREVRRMIPYPERL